MTGLQLLLVLLPGTAWAGPGTSVGSTLTQPMSGRAAAMGEAYVTAEDDVLGVQYNPASLIRHRQAAALLDRGHIGESNTGILAVGGPMKWGRLAGVLTYHDEGSIVLESVDGNQRQVTAQQDMIAAVSAAINLPRRVSVGGTFKYLRSTLVEEFTASAVMFDLGTQWRPAAETALGLSLVNLGPGLQYAGETEDLPMTLRAGASQRLQFLAHRLLLSAELERSDGESRGNFGLEQSLGPLFRVRFGFRTGLETARITTGLGFLWDRYTVDYAFIPVAGSPGLDRSHRISFGMKF